MSAEGLAWELPGGGRALFTDRSHGNLSSVAGEGRERGVEARERLRGAVGAGSLARGFQVHGSRVRRLYAPPPEPPRAGGPDEADGQATAVAGIAPLVLTADCLPVALGGEGAVAMVHAGWRGLAGGVLEEGVAALRELGLRGDILAVVGPGAGPCCYEVGEDLRARFSPAHLRGSNLDLRAAAHERLRAAGVAEIADVEACTICDERFFSHRREGARAGRQGGVAWLS